MSKNKQITHFFKKLPKTPVQADKKVGSYSIVNLFFLSSFIIRYDSLYYLGQSLSFKFLQGCHCTIIFPPAPYSISSNSAAVNTFAAVVKPKMMIQLNHIHITFEKLLLSDKGY